MSGPRFIFVSPVLAWPPDQGSKRFLLETARALLRLGEVCWITRDLGESAAAHERLSAEGFELALVDSHRARNPLARVLRRAQSELRARRRDEPRAAEYCCPPALIRRVQAKLTQWPDAYVVGGYWTMGRAIEVGPAGRRVLIAPDVEHRTATEGHELAGGTQLPHAIERLRRAELAAYAQCDLLLCLTREDVGLARQAMEESELESAPPVEQWPASIPVEPTPPAHHPRAGGSPLRLLCYGHWTPEFNRDGLISFLLNIWPQVISNNSDMELRVVGPGLDGELRARIDEVGAQAVGWVDELSAELAACDGVVLYLDYAGGLRYRLLEALAAARPVVSNAVAARGSGAQPGVHYLEANTAREWGEALGRLRDAGEAHRIAIGGHAFVLERYSSQAQEGRLRRVLARLLESNPGVGRS